MISEQTTVGVEIEVQNLPRIGTKGLESWLRFEAHDDGSIRAQTYRAGELAVYPEFDQNGEPILCTGMQAAERIGLEITTRPYTFSDFFDLSKKLSYYFSSIPQTPRTSIHVHVDVANESWKTVKNLVLWARALEAPIYRIACGGLVHRGERSFNGEPNDHKYARPLSDPIGISWGRSLGALVQWDLLANSKTASDFVASWGRLDWYWGGAGLTHYCPHRLMMVNLASVLRQGTFEWRVFDGMYTEIDTIVEFVYKFHKLAASGEPDFPNMDLGTQPNIDETWLGNLLDMDISRLWGNRWPNPCQGRHKRSHYNDAPTLQTIGGDPVHQINNGRTRDDGTEAWPLFLRRG